jgi:hypothetical protein
VLQLLIWFGLFIYLRIPLSPPSPSKEAANTSSSNLDLIPATTTTTTTDRITNNIADHFNDKKITKLSMYQIVWWDESHQVCKLATDGNGKKKA